MRRRQRRWGAAPNRHAEPLMSSRGCAAGPVLLEQACQVMLFAACVRLQARAHAQRCTGREGAELLPFR